MQQQNNVHDYGVFATANVMEFAVNRYSGLKEDKIGIVFIQSKMREQLIQYSKQNYFIFYLFIYIFTRVLLLRFCIASSDSAHKFNKDKFKINCN